MFRLMKGSGGVISHRNSSITTAVVAVAVTVGIFGTIGQEYHHHHRAYAMGSTSTTTMRTTNLSESIQQSLPQLYDATLKRIMDYTTDPITKSVTANIDDDTDDSTVPLSLRSVLQEQEPPLPSVCFVIRRPG